MPVERGQQPPFILERRLPQIWLITEELIGKQTKKFIPEIMEWDQKALLMWYEL